METGQLLRPKYLYSGTTFSACAIANFVGRLVASSIQLGDSGICRAVAQDASAQVLTPSHNLASPNELRRLILTRYRNNLIGEGGGYDLRNGYNFHQLQELPQTYGRYIDGYILHNSKLYYVNPNSNQPEEITITDSAGFQATLELVMADNTSYPLKDVLDKAFNTYLWKTTKTKRHDHLRISEHNLRRLLNHCAPHKDLAEIPDANLFHAIGNARCFGNGIISAVAYEPECTQVEIDAADSIIAFTDGADNLKLVDMAKFAKTASISKEAFLRGSKDDITTLIATELAKLPPGKTLLLMIADGHGDDGDKISAEAIQIFKLKFCVQLGIKNVDDVVVKVVAPKSTAPLPLNPQMFTAAAPPPSPGDTSSKTLPVHAADDKAKLGDDPNVKSTAPLTFSVG